jgi:CRISPR-associated endonuclease Csn1
MQSSLQKKYTLGLDIGQTSIGAALVGEKDFQGLYVRIFDSCAETSQDSKKYKSVRKRLRRKSKRIRDLLRLFIKHGMLPGEGSQRIKNTPAWRLRAEGLDRKLLPKEWAYVLYHIVKHRGPSLRSLNSSDGKNKQEKGKIKKQAQNNQSYMDEKKYRTPGEMFALDPQYADKKRNGNGDYKCSISRDALKKELQILFEKQKSYGNPHIGDLFKEHVIEIFERQKPSLEGDDLLKMVGRCSLEKDEKRAPKACLTIQRFETLQKINNTKILSSKGKVSLNDQQKKDIENLIFSHEEVTLEQVCKTLQLDKKEESLNAKDELFFKATYYHAIKAFFKEHGFEKTLWEKYKSNTNFMDKIAYACSVYKDPSSLREFLQKQQIEEELIKVLVGSDEKEGLSFDGFSSISLKAAEKILPLLEQGMMFHEAKEKCYPCIKKIDYDQKIRKENIPFVSNPVVKRVLHQTAHLVNAIIRKHGMPENINIELAREFSTEKRKKAYEKTSKENKKKKDECLKEYKNEKLSGKDKLKIIFYKEQDGKCVYCKKGLNLACREKEIEIEHIYHRSFSGDNSLNNKVAACVKCNRDKGTLLPHEYVLDWDHYCSFIKILHNLPQEKKRRLTSKIQREEIESQFKNRALQDTRYASKLCKDMLEESLGVQCLCVNGMYTAHMRNNFEIGTKNRNSHMHHAQDAALVAIANEKTYQGILKAYKDKRKGKKAEFPVPFQEFLHLKDNVKIADLSESHMPVYNDANQLLVHYSRKHSRRETTGAIHKATVHSICKDPRRRTGEKKIYENLKTLYKDYVESKDKQNFFDQLVCKDRDIKLFNAIKEAFENKTFNGLVIKPSQNTENDKKSYVKRVQIWSKTSKEGFEVREGWAEKGGMHHVDIFKAGKSYYGVPVYVGDVLSNALPDAFDWLTKKANKKIENPSDLVFVMSVYPNDFIVIHTKKKTIEGFYKCFDISHNEVRIENKNDTESKNNFRAVITQCLFVKKYDVNMLGKKRISPFKERSWV